MNDKEPRIFLTPEQAISLLPEGDIIHTQVGGAIGVMIGADWDREEIIEKINGAYLREIAGPIARSMGHALVLFPAKECYHSDLLFVETVSEKVDALEEELLN